MPAALDDRRALERGEIPERGRVENEWRPVRVQEDAAGAVHRNGALDPCLVLDGDQLGRAGLEVRGVDQEIGRASCRERV